MSALSIPTFGEKRGGADYIIREGAYAVIPNDKIQIAAISGPSGHYLLGGGIEQNETCEEALTREIMEECAASVELIARIGQATDYIYSAGENAHFEKRGVFYFARFTSSFETDKVIWIAREEVLRSFRQAGHIWAVTQTLLLCARNFSPSAGT